MAYQPPPGYPPPPPGGYGPPSGYGPASGYDQYGRPIYGYGQPAPPPRPVVHPGANGALMFGLAGFCLMAFTGVPAILLGYKAIRDIDGAPQRYIGRNRAIAGVILGWIGCGLFALVVGRGMASSSIGLGIAAILVGIGAVAGLVTTSKKKSWAVSRTIALASAPALLTTGAAWGEGLRVVDARFEAGLCEKDMADANTAVTAKDFGRARSALSLARDKCKDTDAAKLADIDRTVTQGEQAAKAAAAASAAAEQAAAAAAKEKQAVETFPQKTAEINASYKRALNETYSGQWSSADNDLTSAENELSSFNGTSVATTKDWSDLNARLVALRAKVQPQLDRIAERQRKEQAAEEAKAEKERQAAAAVDAVRGPQPQNSAWDGSIPCVERYLKRVLNDPDSYQHVSTTSPVAVGSYWVVVSQFRAKNGFGALTLHQGTFKIQQDQVVDMQED